MVARAARPDDRKELVIVKRLPKKPVSVLPSVATAHFLDWNSRTIGKQAVQW
jgi:hypothetical protein